MIITFDRPITTAVAADLKIRDGAATDWPGAVTANSVSFSPDNKNLTWTFTGSPMMAGEKLAQNSQTAKLATLPEVVVEAFYLA